jgi:hypothetical protein
VILGLPWLRKHNPQIDWESLQLEFTEHCHGRCLPYQIASQIAQQATANSNEKVQSYKRYHAIVEDEVDSDKEDNNMTNEETVMDATTSATSKGGVCTVTARRSAMMAGITSATSKGDMYAVTAERSTVMAVTTNATSKGDVCAVIARRSAMMTVTTNATRKMAVRAITSIARDVGTITTGRLSPTRSSRPIMLTADSRKPAPGSRRCRPLARPPL